MGNCFSRVAVSTLLVFGMTSTMGNPNEPCFHDAICDFGFRCMDEICQPIAHNRMLMGVEEGNTNNDVKMPPGSEPFPKPSPPTSPSSPHPPSASSGAVQQSVDSVLVQLNLWDELTPEPRREKVQDALVRAKYDTINDLMEADKGDLMEEDKGAAGLSAEQATAIVQYFAPRRKAAPPLVQQEPKTVEDLLRILTICDEPTQQEGVTVQKALHDNKFYEIRDLRTAEQEDLTESRIWLKPLQAEIIVNYLHPERMASM